MGVFEKRGGPSVRKVPPSHTKQEVESQRAGSVPLQRNHPRREHGTTSVGISGKDLVYYHWGGTCSLTRGKLEFTELPSKGS